MQASDGRAGFKRRRAICAQLLGLWWLSGCKPAESVPGPSPHAIELATKMRSGTARDPVSGFELPWRLFVPPTYDENRKYPLVLFLHSGDARGDDNVRHLTEDVGEWTSRAQRVEPALVLAPHCPGGRKWADTGGRPFRNYDQRQVKENEVGRAVR